MPLLLKLPSRELFDEATSRFVTVKESSVILEHSLYSLAKWESIWHIPFLESCAKLTKKQAVSYYDCMAYKSEVVPENFALRLTRDDIKKIESYISDPMTASTYNQTKSKTANKEIITAEVLYYLMASYGIPFEECEHWHLNRLMSLLQMCSVKSGPEQKMSKRETAAYYKALNDARRVRMHTRG